MGQFRNLMLAVNQSGKKNLLALPTLNPGGYDSFFVVVVYNLLMHTLSTTWTTSFQLIPSGGWGMRRSQTNKQTNRQTFVDLYIAWYDYYSPFFIQSVTSAKAVSWQEVTILGGSSLWRILDWVFKNLERSQVAGNVSCRVFAKGSHVEFLREVQFNIHPRDGTHIDVVPYLRNTEDNSLFFNTKSRLI